MTDDGAIKHDWDGESSIIIVRSANGGYTVYPAFGRMYDSSYPAYASLSTASELARWVADRVRAKTDGGA